jgi:cell migration-inducing and hyaluronan-binding protein
LREFSGNTAHSNFDGVMFDRGPSANGTFNVGGAGPYQLCRSHDTKSPIVVATIDNYTAYKNRNGAIWSRARAHLYRNMRLADNAIGFTHASGGAGLAPYTSRVVDSLFVGESDNIGNPRTPQEIAYGRSLPKGSADFPIRGYEYYDYRHEVVNTTFVNYQPNATRDAGALSYLLFTSFGMSTENTVEGLKFVNAKPVDFPQVQTRWASDFGRRAAYRSAAFHDLDGSVGGTPAPTSSSTTASPPTKAPAKSGRAGVRRCAGATWAASTSPATSTISGGSPLPIRSCSTATASGSSTAGRTTIPSGAEVRVETAGKDLSLALREMDKDAFVILELPGFTKAASGTAQSQPGGAARSAQHVVLPGRQHPVGQARGRGDPTPQRPRRRPGRCSACPTMIDVSRYRGILAADADENSTDTRRHGPREGTPNENRKTIGQPLVEAWQGHHQGPIVLAGVGLATTARAECRPRDASGAGRTLP